MSRRMFAGLGVLALALFGCGKAAPKPDTPPATESSKAQSSPAATETSPATSIAARPTPAAPPSEDAQPAVAPESAPAETQTNEKPGEPKPVPAATVAEESAPEKPAPPPPEVAGLTRLGGEETEVWLDNKGKRVFVGGRVVRTEGQLEMFACLKNSKEHESIVAANTKAVNVNAALIALGANPGQPVQFRPEFKPAHGPEVEVSVLWTDKQGKRQRVRAQEWIRDLKTGKALAQPWVFGGSGFWVDDMGQQHFMAEDGDFICISNFTSAMLDLPVESSQATADLQFEAFTSRIPPVDTPVLLELKPKLEREEAAKLPDEST